jgi:hypothetical protein
MAELTEVHACRRRRFPSTFPIFVPSLSWQNRRVYIQMTQKQTFRFIPGAGHFVGALMETLWSLFQTRQGEWSGAASGSGIWSSNPPENKREKTVPFQGGVGGQC